MFCFFCFLSRLVVVIAVVIAVVIVVDQIVLGLIWFGQCKCNAFQNYTYISEFCFKNFPHSLVFIFWTLSLSFQQSMPIRWAKKNWLRWRRHTSHSKNDKNNVKSRFYICSTWMHALHFITLCDDIPDDARYDDCELRNITLFRRKSIESIRP